MKKRLAAFALFTLILGVAFPAMSTEAIVGTEEIDIDLNSVEISSNEVNKYKIIDGDLGTSWLSTTIPGQVGPDYDCSLKINNVPERAYRVVLTATIGAFYGDPDPDDAWVKLGDQKIKWSEPYVSLPGYGREVREFIFKPTQEETLIDIKGSFGMVIYEVEVFGLIEDGDALAYWSFDTVTVNAAGDRGYFEDHFGSNDTTGIITTVVNDGKGSSIRTGGPLTDILHTGTQLDNFRFGSSPFTLSCWIKLDSTQTREIQTILTTKNVGDNTCGFSLFYYHDATRDRIALKIADGGEYSGDTTNGGQVVLSSKDNKIENGQWHHIVAVRNGSDSEIYIDGVQETDDAISVDLNSRSADGTHSLLIGTDNCNPVDGLIDEVKIYSDVMNSDQVATTYNNAKVFFPQL